MPTSPVIVSDLANYQSGDPQTLIDQATALVRSYCGWHVSPSATDTVTVMGSGRPSILLPSLYVTAVTSVVENGTTLTTDDYVWDASGIIGRVDVPWTAPSNAVTVTFTHGYDQADDFAAVILAVASRAQASPDGVVRRQAGLVSETYSQTGAGTAGGVSLLPSEKETLRAYRIPRTP
jgi:hypothetical protein